MLEPFVERLSRFTPVPGSLDRDALLFAAGQASVRRTGRAWAVLVGSLAASQLLTLVLLWPEAKSPLGPVVRAPAVPETAVAAEPPAAMEATALATLNRRVLQSESGDLPREAAVERLVAAAPPLRASATAAQMELD